MLPYIDNQDRDRPPLGKVLMFFGLEYLKAAPCRVPNQNAPAGSLNGIGEHCELVSECIKVSKGEFRLGPKRMGRGPRLLAESCWSSICCEVYALSR